MKGRYRDRPYNSIYPPPPPPRRWPPLSSSRLRPPLAPHSPPPLRSYTPRLRYSPCPLFVHITANLEFRAFPATGGQACVLLLPPPRLSQPQEWGENRSFPTQRHKGHQESPALLLPLCALSVLCERNSEGPLVRIRSNLRQPNPTPIPPPRWCWC